MALTPFLKDFLEANPNQAGVQAAIPVAGDFGGSGRTASIAGSNQFQEYWRGQAGNVYNQYLGEFARNPVASAAKGGLGGYLERFPWLTKFQDLSPASRGEQPTRYAPRVRWSG
jgi:hypothetical protein|tara:strand:+ start:159 stop:500 length:342 start_codon:yes stop_codon:yes gene_type:complete